MLLIDTEEGRIISDDEIKNKVAAEHPYREWLDKNLIALEDLVDQDKPVHEAHGTVVQRQQVFGYNYEDLRVVIEPMAKNGVEPVGAMGTDTPLGRAFRQTPTASKLFQATLCPGHEPAHRLFA
jgi:glutamate synthase (NADPH/NADH) large chain